jgi:hypothetical protein
MAWAGFRREHRDATVLLSILITVCVSAVLAEYMSISMTQGERTFVAQVLGAQLYLTPVATGVLISGMVASEMYLVSRLERVGRMAEAVVLMSVAMAAGFLTLAFAKGFVDTFFGASSGVAVMATLSLGVFLSIFLTFLVLIGEYSETVKNALLTVFSSTMGAFFGLIFPTLQLLLLMVTMMGLDVVLTYGSSRTASSWRPSRLAFTTRDWGVGLGDLIVYTTVTGKALVAYGPLVFVASALLLMLGISAAVALVRRWNWSSVPGVLWGGGFASLPMVACLLWASTNV